MEITTNQIYMPKLLIRPTSKGQVTLPVSIRKKLRLNAETFLEVLTEGPKIVLKPVKFENQDYRFYQDEEIAEFLKEDKISRQDAKFFQKVLGRPHGQGK
jgi:AbrB family looped-hinge helix DNA binding protein